MRRSSRLEIYWSRLAGNWQKVQALAPQALLLPMIKANAYGHGLVEIGTFLHRELRAPALGVACLGEASMFLQKVPQFSGKVVVFSEHNLLEPDTSKLYQDNRIIPVIHDLVALKEFLANPIFKRTPLYLKLNTGMNRLGLEEQEWEDVAGQLKAQGRSVQHLMTHFARSTDPLCPGDKTQRQMEHFKKGLSFFRDQGITVEETSVANTGAIEQRFGVEETWVRPGLMLYGPHGGKHGVTEMISSFVTHVLRVFQVKRGVPVGYGVNVTAEDGVIAVLPLGYGDGLPTQLAGHSIMVNGLVGKIFGRINMDMAFIFFPTEAWGKIHAGDEVRFWDRDTAAVEAWAKHMGTHTYQAMCGISARIPRVFLLG